MIPLCPLIRVVSSSPTECSLAGQPDKETAPGLTEGE